MAVNQTVYFSFSDNLLADVSTAASSARFLDERVFIPNYSALPSVMTSEYVKKYLRQQAFEWIGFSYWYFLVV